MSRIRLNVVLTHPVQYLAPWFSFIAAKRPEIDLHVLYATAPTPEQQGVGFETPFVWDRPLTQGYSHEFLREAKPHDRFDAGSFRGVDAPEVVRRLRDLCPDVLLVPGWHSITYLRALRAARKLGIPTLYRGDTNFGSAPWGLRRVGWRFRARHWLRCYDAFLSVGSRSREFLLGCGVPPQKIFASPHCVDNDFFSSRADDLWNRNGDRADLRARYNLAGDGFVVLYVGKLEAKKRPEDAIRAVAKLPQAVLLVAGHGELRDVCLLTARAIGCDARFLGFKNQSELPELYALSDCLVLPSGGRETWGLVVNEAMASGLPCVVSDRVGCAPDLVIPGETGEVFPCGDVEALARALEGVRQNILRGHDYSRHCRERVSTFSFERAAEGLVAACQYAKTSRRMAADRPRIVACLGGMVVVSGLERSTFEILGAMRDRGALLHAILNDWENHRIVPLVEAIGGTWSTAPYRSRLERKTRNPVRIARYGLEILRIATELLRSALRLGATHVFLPDFMTVIRNAPALFLLRLGGRRVVLRVGNTVVSDDFYRRVWRWAVAPFVDRIVCNSEASARALREFGIEERKIAVIRTALPPSPAQEVARVVPDPAKVLYVGQTIPEKGVHFLLDACGELVRRGIDVKLDVVGSMNGWVPPEYEGYRERLLARSSEPDLSGRVRFLGWRTDVPELLAGAGIHCVPSMPEGLPRVVLEAKRAGVPSVAFRLGAFPEVIEHRVDGWLCDEVSARSLAEGLAFFLSRPAERERAAQAARESFRRFDWEAFTESWWKEFGR